MVSKLANLSATLKIRGSGREGPQNFGRETETVNSSQLGLQPNLPQGGDDMM
jgi:hypothetical protein